MRRGRRRRKLDKRGEKKDVDNGPKTPKGEIRPEGVTMTTKPLVAIVTQPTLPWLRCHPPVSLQFSFTSRSDKTYRHPLLPTLKSRNIYLCLNRSSH